MFRINKLAFLPVLSILCSNPSNAFAAQTPELEQAFLRAVALDDQASMLKLADGAQGFLIRERLSNGDTPLGVAVKLGRKVLVDRLLAHGADPNEADLSGWLPLGVAVMTGRPEIASALVDKGARTDARLPGMVTPASLAISSGSVAMREALRLGVPAADLPSLQLFAAIIADDQEKIKAAIAAGARADSVDEEGSPMIVLAALNGRSRSLSQLIDAGAPINQKTPNGTTPLIAAALSGHVDEIRLLLERGASLDAKTVNGLTALDAVRASGVQTAVLLVERAAGKISPEIAARLLYEAAARGDHSEVERLLLQERVPVNGLGANSTLIPLIPAAYRGHFPVVGRLLASGADPSLRDSRGHTPVLAATLGGHEQIVKFLLQRNAAADTATVDNMTPMTAALLSGRDDIIRELQKAVDLDKPNLMLATQRGDVEMLRRHFMGSDENRTKPNPDVNLFDGRTLLAVAAGTGNVQVLELLVASGASVDGINQQDTTPLAAAASEGKDQAVKWLLAAGADPLSLSRGLTPRQIAARRQRRSTEAVLNAAERERARSISQALFSFGYPVKVDDVWNNEKLANLENFKRDQNRFYQSNILSWINLADRSVIRACNVGTTDIYLAFARYTKAQGPEGRDVRVSGYTSVKSGTCKILAERQSNTAYGLHIVRNGRSVTRPQAGDPSFCVHPSDGFNHYGIGAASSSCSVSSGYRATQFQMLPDGLIISSMVSFR